MSAAAALPGLPDKQFDRPFFQWLGPASSCPVQARTRDKITWTKNRKSPVKDLAGETLNSDMHRPCRSKPEAEVWI